MISEKFFKQIFQKNCNREICSHFRPNAVSSCKRVRVDLKGRAPPRRHPQSAEAEVDLQGAEKLGRRRRTRRRKQQRVWRHPLTPGDAARDAARRLQQRRTERQPKVSLLGSSRRRGWCSRGLFMAPLGQGRGELGTYSLAATPMRKVSSRCRLDGFSEPAESVDQVPGTNHEQNCMLGLTTYLPLATTKRTTAF